MLSLLTGETLPSIPGKNSTVLYHQTNCLQGNGESYTGTLSVTMHGHTCLDWNHAKVKAKSKNFNREVILLKNYCRNPDGDLEGPWCYVNEAGNITMDYCNLELCGELNGEIIFSWSPRLLPRLFSVECTSAFLKRHANVTFVFQMLLWKG